MEAPQILAQAVTKCNRIIEEYLKPDSGITEKECLQKLIEELDNEEVVKALEEI